MNFKKIALLVLVCAVAYGFSVHTASANTVTTEESKETTPVATVLPEVTASPAATAAPVAETQDTVKNETAKSELQKGKKIKKKKAYTKAELRLMASIINCEAGGECYQGKLAVGIVVMNRVKSKAFPNTVKGVIYQKYQFSPVRNGSLKKRLAEYDKGHTKSAQWKSCISAAKKTLAGQTTIIKSGKVKSMKGIHFFSVMLSGAKFRLGGHRFK